MTRLTHRLPPANGGPARRLVVFLHGVGARGDDLEPLARMWRAALPDAAMALPDGVEPYDMAPMGRQWFSVNGVTPANRGERVAAAAAAFDGVLAEELAAAGVPLEELILVGFSQGTIMSLDALATGRWAPRAVVGYSGRLARGPEGAGIGAKTPVLLVHGTADPVIPVRETEGAAQALRAAGTAVKTLIEPGVEHTISQAGAQAGLDFLRAVLTPPSA